MITRHTARTLTRYNRWANKLIFDATFKLPEGEATRPRQSVFKNIVHTLNHNYVIDRIFQAHLEGRAHGYTARNTPDWPALEALWSDQQVIDDWYVDWSDGISDQGLDERVRFSFVGGGDGEMTRGEILMHLVNHTSYHRGFVADIFCQIPARAPAADLTVFLRDARPDLA